ncbi:hypothetical protein DZG02_03770, partial [Clavibacter lycopersici]|uniref:hypothetical protein n=1 Tax=Clavibacter lycopersici TaxID=2301718 RepID=UPI000EDE990A
MLLDVPALMGPPVVRAAPAFLVSVADRRDLDAYLRLRHDAFVEEQGIFAGTDLDALDGDPRTVVRPGGVARATADQAQPSACSRSS